jgi:hypothetical protein
VKHYPTSITLTRTSAKLFKVGDRTSVGGRVAVVVAVDELRRVLTLAWRDAWYWRALRYLEADYDRTRDHALRVLAWLRGVSDRLLDFDPANSWP